MPNGDAGEAMSTDQHFVYVIELGQDAKQRPGWLSRNPNQTRPKCYYVGSSAHTPECRFEQHRAPADEPFLCQCHVIPGQPVLQNQVGKWPEALRLEPRRYEHWTGRIPSRTRAEKLEARIARRLMDEGYGVWTNRSFQSAD